MRFLSGGAFVRILKIINGTFVRFFLVTFVDVSFGCYLLTNEEKDKIFYYVEKIFNYFASFFNEFLKAVFILLLSPYS